MHSASNRILKQFRTAQAEQVGYRGDMHLADSRFLSKRTAHILVGFEPTLGVPTRDDLKALTARLGKGITPAIKTARYYPDEAVIALVVFQNVESKAMSAADDMHEVIADTQYMDMRTADVWNVEEVDGKRVLIRQAEDDIDAILKERRRRVKQPNATFGQLKTAATIQHLDTGDRVEFYHHDEIKEGSVHRIVRSADGIDHALIEQDGEITDVPLTAVTNVLTAAGGSIEQEQQKLYEYYRQIYGEEYARQLVRME